MNSEVAKLVLGACRPINANVNDPRLAEALTVVAHDDELRAWYEAEQAADKVIAAKLKTAPLPEDLLAQVRAGTQARLAGRPRTTSFPLALAACLALVGLIASLWWLNRPLAVAPESFAAYRTDMAQLLREFPRLDLATDRLPEVREWLARQHSLTQFQLPKSLEQFPSIGCRTVAWRDKKLALICFMVEGQVVHLFVMPRTAFPDANLGVSPQLARLGSQHTAGWSDDDNLYLLVTQADQTLLEKILL